MNYTVYDYVSLPRSRLDTPPLSVFRIIVFFVYRDSWVHFEGAIEIIDRTPPTRLQRRSPSSGREMQIDSYIEYIFESSMS